MSVFIASTIYDLGSKTDASAFYDNYDFENHFSIMQLFIVRISEACDRNNMGLLLDLYDFIEEEYGDFIFSQPRVIDLVDQGKNFLEKTIILEAVHNSIDTKDYVLQKFMSNYLSTLLIYSFLETIQGYEGKMFNPNSIDSSWFALLRKKLIELNDIKFID